MTYLKVLGLFLSLVTPQSFAQDSTPHSFNKFCSDAKADLDNLNKLSSDKLIKINELSLSVEKLDAQIKLLDGISAAVSNYKNAFDTAANEQFSKQDDYNKLKLVQFQNLLAASLNLKAIELLTKPEANVETNNKRSKVSTLEELCSIEGNANEPICKSDQKSFGKELDNLNKTISNFNTLQQKADNPKIAKQAQELYDSIPKSINPDSTISLLLGSPKLKSIIDDQTSSSISACLDKQNANQLQECGKLMASHQGLTDELKAVFFKLSESNKLTWESNSLNSKVIETSNRLISQFDSKQLDSSFTDLEVIKKSFEELKEKCKQMPETNDALARCVELNNLLDREAYKMSSNLQAEKKQKMNVLSETTNGSPTFDFLEKMKNYISTKFKRSCSNSPDELPVSNLCNNSTPANGAISLSNLSEQVKQIINRVSPAVSSSSGSSRGEFGIFSKKELQDYSNYCANNSTNSCANKNANVCDKICSEVSAEYKRIKDYKDATDWDEYQSKYWVDMNPNGKDSYTAHAKKSNWRILGEGLAQSNILSQGMNIWISDMQLQSQIDMMTQQALFQKQLMYMNNPNSPWMLNYPYFPNINITTPNAAGGFNFGK